MTIQIITADQRLSEANNKTSLAIFGPPGVGKTSLLHTLPHDKTVCLDLEAGLKSVQGWGGASIPVRTFEDFRDLCVLIGGPDPSSQDWFSQGHFDHVSQKYADAKDFLAQRPIVFVDSITDLTRQVMTYAKGQPEAFSDKTGKPDIRGAYGLLGREVIRALKHLQHAAGKTVIFVGVLEKVTDDFNVVTWQPQMEGSKAGRELPGIVDQVVTMHLFRRDESGAPVFDEKGEERLLGCRTGNPWGLPAKDRSGRLAVTEAPNLSNLLDKINGKA